MSSSPPTASSGRDALGPPPPPAPAEVPPDPVARQRNGLAAVPVWSPFIAILATIVVATLATFLIVGVVDLGGGEIDADSLPPGVLLSGTLVQDAAFLAFAYLFTRAWAGEVRPSTFGLRLAPVGRSLLWTVAIYVAFWISVVLYTALIGEGPQQDIVTDLREQDSLVVLGGFALLVGIAAPLTEELFFRGFLFGVLREKIGVLAAALIAGAVFGLIHAAGTPVRTLGILVLLGIGLCFLYAKTGSLLPCMGLHAFHNSISFAFTKEVSPLLGLALVAGSVALTLAVAAAVVRSERSASP